MGNCGNIAAVRSLAFTGHRPDKIGGYSVQNPTRVWVNEALKDVVLGAHHGGFTEFITGGALGVDQEAAWTVLALRGTRPEVRLTIAVPCSGQDRVWPERAREEYAKLLSMADDAIVLSLEYTPQCMQRRNEWMVDHATALCAVWNGSMGGTGNCVKYALGKGMRILVIDPKDQVKGWLRKGLTWEDTVGYDDLRNLVREA